MGYGDNSKRSLAKSATFRVLVVISDIVVIFLVTHRLETTIALTVFTNLASTALYFLHERAWNRFGWGRNLPGQTRPSV